ncbi:MAG: hypothetical protein ACRC6T_02275 [Sarcina sp.]
MSDGKIIEVYNKGLTEVMSVIRLLIFRNYIVLYSFLRYKIITRVNVISFSS